MSSLTSVAAVIGRFEWISSTAKAAQEKTILPPHQRPRNEYLLEYILALTFMALLLIVQFKRLADAGRENVLRSCGVSLNKISRSIREIKRKGFHLAGLLVPLIQRLLLLNGYTNYDCVRICWTITIVGTSMDWLRVHSKTVAANWPLRSILRDHEHLQLTGGSYFSLGCTLAICAHHTGAPPLHSTRLAPAFAARHLCHLPL